METQQLNLAKPNLEMAKMEWFFNSNIFLILEWTEFKFQKPKECIFKTLKIDKFIYSISRRRDMLIFTAFVDKKQGLYMTWRGNPEPPQLIIPLGKLNI